MEQKQLPATLKALLADLDAQGIHDHRRYAAVRRYLSFKAREKAIPICGSFELTPLCNFDCKMCYVHLKKDQMCGKPLLTVNQWKAIMRQAVDGGMMFASLTGGECLTYPGFEELYLFLRSLGVEVTILSNGALMDARRVEFLKKNPPAQVQITLYGVSEDDYERVTGQRAFETVWTNVLSLKQAGIPLKIAVTPNGFMQDGEALVRLVHEADLPLAINAGLLQPRADTGRALADASLDTYISMQRLALELRNVSINAQRDPEEIPEPGAPGGEGAKGVRCGAGRSCFAVDWQGGMRPCNAFPCEAQSVPKLGFSECWQRVHCTASEYLRPAECEHCAFQEQCKNCVAEHASQAPEGHASPAVCAWAKRMFSEGLLILQ